MKRNVFTEEKKTIKDLLLGVDAEDVLKLVKDIEHSVIMDSGRLIVQPEFQRSYIREISGAKAQWVKNLILSIIKGNPIGIIHLGLTSTEGVRDVMDGQQRLITILLFQRNKFPIMIDGIANYYRDLTKENKDFFDNYELTFCTLESTDFNDKYEFFEAINQQGATLTQQEIRNSVCGGPWLRSVQKAFVTWEGNKYGKDKITDDNYRYSLRRYIDNVKEEDFKRQNALATVLNWISATESNAYDNDKLIKEDERIRAFMKKSASEHNDAQEIINQYESICDWLYDTFKLGGSEFSNRKVKGTPTCISAKGLSDINIGELYYRYSKKEYSEADKQWFHDKLLEYVDNSGTLGITKTHKIVPFLLKAFPIRMNYEEFNELAKKMLQIRPFSDADKRMIYELQGGKDPYTREKLDITEMQAHHIKSFCLGGNSDKSNLVMLSAKTHLQCHNGIIAPDMLRLKRRELILSEHPEFEGHQEFGL